MNGIPVIGLHTPEQTAALQAATGMIVTISRRGARLVPVASFKILIDTDNAHHADQIAKDAA